MQGLCSELGCHADLLSQSPLDHVDKPYLPNGFCTVDVLNPLLSFLGSNN